MVVGVAFVGGKVDFFEELGFVVFELADCAGSLAVVVVWGGGGSDPF